VVVDVIAMHLNALIVLMMYVTIVVVKKMIFQHEDMILDTTISSKSKLYKNNKLLFMGDGYKAITIMLNSSKDNTPVKDKFWAQLSTREKPKFDKSEDALEKLRREAQASIVKTTKKKRR
tara:strand:- start:1969 stop:2328 length:360 start_codon:yes stop_codon:yes gene_type:complete